MIIEKMEVVESDSDLEFEDRLMKVIQEYQSKGYTIEVQYSYSVGILFKGYSALVIGKKK